MSRNIINNGEIDLFNNQEIDLKEIFAKLQRNKRLISSFTLISVLISIFYSSIAKKIWEGEFQIVLDRESETAGFANNFKGLPVPVLETVEDPLETQVGILQSPLVLSKVFDFVKKEKSIKNDQKSSFQFNLWKNNSLDISLEKGTSILNISYRDDKKDLILPVLTKISNSYQDYSGRNRSREIELSKNFFEKQIELYRKKSINSLISAQNFATEQDITILSGEATIDKEIPNTINIEAIRAESANEIRNINIQLDQLKKLNDNESIMYLGRSIPEIVEQGLPQQLDDIDRTLLEIEDQLEQIKNLENESTNLILIARSIPELVTSGLPERLEMIEDELITLSTLKEEILRLQENPEKIQYYANSIPQIQDTDLPENLKDIETRLEIAKFVYKDEDKTIIDLKREKEILNKVFKKQALGYLEADIVKTIKSKPKLFEKLKEQTINSLESKKFNIEQSKPRLISLLKKKSISFLEARKATAVARLEASERPEGVLIKYRQLIGEANKDRATLDSLENEYRAVLLEEARTKDPWELITSPTLLSSPVAPKKKQIVLITFLASLLFSSLITIILEKRKNIIFSLREMRSLTKWDILSQISIKDSKEFAKSYKYILKNNLNESNDNIEILLIGKLEKNLLKNLQKTADEIKLNKYRFSENIFDLDKISPVIVITALGITKQEEYLEIENHLTINKKNVIGNIVLKDVILPKNNKDYLELFIINSIKYLNNFKKDLIDMYSKYTFEFFKDKCKYYNEILKKNLEIKK